MADPRVQVELGTNGAEKVAQAAGRAMEPWIRESKRARDAFGALGSAVTTVSRGIISDLGHIITAGGALTLGSAINGMLNFETAAAKMGITTRRSFDNIKEDMRRLSKDTGMPMSYLTNLELSTGKKLYDFKMASASTRPMINAARAFGREPEEMQPAIFAMQQVRIGASGVSSAFQQILGYGEKLGGLQGAAKLLDQFTALHQIFQRTSLDMKGILDLTSRIGKGMPTALQGQVQQGMIGALSDPYRAIVWQAVGRQMGVLRPGERTADEKTGVVDDLMTGMVVSAGVDRVKASGHLSKRQVQRLWLAGAGKLPFDLTPDEFLNVKDELFSRKAVDKAHKEQKDRGVLSQFTNIPGILGEGFGLTGGSDEFTNAYKGSLAGGILGLKSQMEAGAIDMVTPVQKAAIDFAKQNPWTAFGASYGLPIGLGVGLTGAGAASNYLLMRSFGKKLARAAATGGARGGGGIPGAGSGVSLESVTVTPAEREAARLSALRYKQGTVAGEMGIDPYYESVSTAKLPPNAPPKPGSMFKLFRSIFGNKAAGWLQGATTGAKVARTVGPVLGTMGEVAGVLGTMAMQSDNPGAYEAQQRALMGPAGSRHKSMLGGLFQWEEPNVSKWTPDRPVSPSPGAIPGWVAPVGGPSGGAVPVDAGARWVAPVGGPSGGAVPVDAGARNGGMTESAIVTAIAAAMQGVSFTVVNMTGGPISIERSAAQCA